MTKPPISTERLAALKQQNTFGASVDARDISLLLEELEKRRAADVKAPRLRWEDQGNGAWYAHAGDLIVAMVTHVTLSKSDPYWKWQIDGVKTKYVVRGSGQADDFDAARKATDEAWAVWCGYAGLREAVLDAAEDEPGIKNSQDYPLRFDVVPVPGSPGKLALTICPGKKYAHSVYTQGGWNRDLLIDVGAIVDHGADAVITLTELDEMERLGVSGLGAALYATGMKWFWLPIEDGNAPDEAFDELWKSAGPTIHALLDQGKSIVVHCNGGLGRAGTLAAMILIDRGVDARSAIETVRRHRGQHAIETRAQEEYLEMYPEAMDTTDD